MPRGTTNGCMGSVNPITILVEEADMSPAEAVDYWKFMWEGLLTQSEWAERRGVSQQAVSKNIDAGVKKACENPEPIFKAVSARLAEFSDGELVESYEEEAIYRVDQTPDDLEKFELDLLDWYGGGEISLIVTGTPVEDSGCRDAQIHITDIY